MHDRVDTDNAASTPVPVKGGVLALGHFDGVHRGHRAVIQAAIERAKGMGMPAQVLTLEPHPRSVLKPDLPPFRLTPAPVKARLLHAAGIDNVIVEPFTDAFLHLSAQDFVEQILVGKYNVRHVVAGFDFVFGFQRTGTMPKLREWLRPHNVGVTEVTPFRDSSGEVMSSSRAREALQRGDMKTASHILGRPWSIAGEVVAGQQRGRQLSVPTANIRLGDYIRPRFGVYVVEAGPVGEIPKYHGVANIGVRPTVDGKTEGLEAHLFNFEGNLYGQQWEVGLLDFIRPEQAFPDVEALRTQIMQDIEVARARLSALAGL